MREQITERQKKKKKMGRKVKKKSGQQSLKGLPAGSAQTLSGGFCASEKPGEKSTKGKK